RRGGEEDWSAEQHREYLEPPGGAIARCDPGDDQRCTDDDTERERIVLQRTPSSNCGASPAISSHAAFEPTKIWPPITRPGSSSSTPAGTQYAAASRSVCGSGEPQLAQNV